MKTGAPSRGALAVVVGFALSCFCLLFYLWVSFGGPVPLAAKGYRFAALYRDASQVPVQADVRISGVHVGRVVGVAQQGRLTRLEMEMEPRFAPIPTDTRTTIRRKTLLGEAYVELTPGTPLARGATPLPDGGALPASQSKPAVAFDQVLDTFDRRTRSGLKALIATLGQAAGNRGTEISNAAGNLEPLAGSGAELVHVLHGQRAEVRALVRDSGGVLNALSERPGALRALVSNSADVLSATAARNRELTRTVQILPTFLGELRPTLAEARQVGLEADPLLRELTPAALRFAGTLRDLRAAAPDVRGLFRDLGPAIAASRPALPATTRLLRSLRPTVKVLHPALRELIPVVDWATLYRREVAAWVAKLAASNQASSLVAGKRVHLIRVLIPFTQEGLSLYEHRLPSNRHNPYPKPGFLDKLGRPNLESFDCTNVAADSNPAPPCRVQGPFSFRGYSADYPHVRRAGR